MMEIKRQKKSDVLGKNKIDWIWLDIEPLWLRHIRLSPGCWSCESGRHLRVTARWAEQPRCYAKPELSRWWWSCNMRQPRVLMFSRQSHGSTSSAAHHTPPQSTATIQYIIYHHQECSLNHRRLNHQYLRQTVHIHVLYIVYMCTHIQVTLIISIFF